jgi:uncharacterized membrane protein YeaQ/YmgE (transglycosylase-associated protein family)
MNWLQTILTLAASGLLVGGLARILLPGRETIGIFGTILAGLAGAFIGGLIVTYLLGNTNFWLTLAVSVACAVVFILPFRLYMAQAVVVPGPGVRRGFWGARSVDPAYDAGYRRPFWSRRSVDPAYDAGYAPGYRRPFWSRRRTLF